MAIRSTVISLALSFSVGLVSMVASAEDTIKEVVSIGTGGVTGVYYPTGGAICRLVNKSRSEHGLRCSTESSAGSVANLNGIEKGDIDFGIAQSDWLYHAYNGSNKFQKSGANKDLRAVFSIHPETFTLVARADSGIKSLDDIVGKRVNIGIEGSGQRGTMATLMKVKGWSKSSFSLAAELKGSEQASALCNNEIDVMVYVIGHPSGAIKEATTSCDSVLVDVSGPSIDQMIKDNRYYQPQMIPGGLYLGNDRSVKSFGVKSVLVSSVETSEDAVYQLVKSVFESFESFRKLHPAFSNLIKEEMAFVTGDEPLHAGAIKYFKEVGYLTVE